MTDQTYPTPEVPTSYPIPPQPSPILRWFEFDHLPHDLQGTSRMFHAIAEFIESTLPSGAEKSTALRKLLEAKDAAVRAAIEGRSR